MRLLIYLAAVGCLTQAQSAKPYLRVETGTHSARVNRIDIDAAERFLVSASDDKTARVWELSSGKLLRILRPPIGDGNEGRLYAIAMSPDGATVAVGGFTGANDSANHPIYIFDRESGAILRTIPGLPEVTHHLAFSLDGRYLAAGLDGNNGVRIFATGTYSEVTRDAGYGGACVWVEFDKAGRLATASEDGSVRLYDSAFHLLQKKNPPGGKRPSSVRFPLDGGLIAVGFYDSSTVDILSGKDLSFQYKLPTPPEGGSLHAAYWSADGQTVCAAGRFAVDAINAVLCWSEKGKGRQGTFPISGNTVMDLRKLHAGGIAFGSGDGNVGVLDRNGKILWRAAPDLLEYSAGPSFPRLSPDGETAEFRGFYFNGERWTRHSLRFSVSSHKLEIDTPSESLSIPPETSGLSIAGWKDGYGPTLDGQALPLQKHEMSRSLAIAQGKEDIILGSDWWIRKFNRQGKQLWGTPVVEAAWGVNITQDGRFVVATLGDGTVRWCTSGKGEEVLALFVDRDLRRWVAWNPDGFFAFEGGGDTLVGYQINRRPDQAGEFVKVDQLRELFYRPDLIAQILKPGAAESVLAARGRIGDISRTLSSGLPPEIDLISPTQANVSGDYLLQFRIKDMGGGRGRIVYRIDGTEIEGRAVEVRGSGSDTINRYIPVGTGATTLTVSAYSANGKIEGPPKTIRITRNLLAVASNLHIIAAGISHYSDNSLSEGVRFAAGDADLVAARFKEQEGKGLYRRVDAVALRDSQATIKGIQAEVARAAAAVQPGDTFVLYLAGHGISVEGDYYFIPWEAEYTNQKDLLSKSLDRQKIQTMLKQIPTNKSVLILDTCGAGAYLEGRAVGEKAAIEKIATMTGRAVLAASNSDQMAMDGYQNHGVFTYALLEGLQRADPNDRGEILVTRLAEFVQIRVPKLTEEKWHVRQLPLSRIDGEPFPIARKSGN